MMLSLGDIYDIAAFDCTFLAVEDYETFAVDECPDFISISMALVADRAAGVECELLGQGAIAVRELCTVNYTVCAPAALFVHGTVLQLCGVCFHVLALAFLRHDYAVGRGRNYKVFRAHAEQGNVELVEYMCITARAVSDDIAVGRTLEFVCQGIPCAKVFPFPIIFDHTDIIGFLSYLIVKTDFGIVGITGLDFCKSIVAIILA